MVGFEIHDIVVNILLNNILVQRGLVPNEQKGEDRKTVRTTRDEITVGTEHLRSDEWKGRGRVAGSRIKPDIVWLRRDARGDWRKVVVAVKITSTDKMNEAFSEKDEKYRVGNKGNKGEESIHGGDGPHHHLPRRGCPQKLGQAVEELCTRHQVDWVRMAQNVLRYNVVIVGKFFNKGSWVSEAWRKEHPEEFEE